MMKFGVRVARVAGKTGEGWKLGRKEKGNSVRRSRGKGGGGRGESAVGYTFEYINVCNSEFVLEWASAILSGGY